MNARSHIVCCYVRVFPVDVCPKEGKAILFSVYVMKHAEAECNCCTRTTERPATVPEVPPSNGSAVAPYRIRIVTVRDAGGDRTLQYVTSQFVCALSCLLFNFHLQSADLSLLPSSLTKVSSTARLHGDSTKKVDVPSALPVHIRC